LWWPVVAGVVAIVPLEAVALVAFFLGLLLLRPTLLTRSLLVLAVPVAHLHPPQVQQA
jgi:hypothetical protein